MILDVDTEGARAVKKAFPDALLVFVSPVSAESLEARLKALDPGRPDEWPHRLAHAREEIARASEYDYVVLSDTLVESAEELSAILRSEHRRAPRAAPGIEGLLRLNTNLAIRN